MLLSNDNFKTSVVSRVIIALLKGLPIPSVQSPETKLSIRSQIDTAKQTRNLIGNFNRISVGVYHSMVYRRPIRRRSRTYGEAEISLAGQSHLSLQRSVHKLTVRSIVERVCLSYDHCLSEPGSESLPLDISTVTHRDPASLLESQHACQNRCDTALHSLAWVAQVVDLRSYTPSGNAYIEHEQGSRISRILGMLEK